MQYNRRYSTLFMDTFVVPEESLSKIDKIMQSPLTEDQIQSTRKALTEVIEGKKVIAPISRLEKICARAGRVIGKK